MRMFILTTLSRYKDFREIPARFIFRKKDHQPSLITRAQLFEGRLALNRPLKPGLNLTRVSLYCVQKHFLE